MLHTASRGHLGATTARELHACAAASVGVVDPYGAAAIAVQTLVAQLEQLRPHVAELGERLDALQAEDAATTALLASIPGFGRETIRTWVAELPPMARFAEQAREQTRMRKKPRQGADKLVAAVGLDAQVKQSGRSAGHARRANAVTATRDARAARTDPQCQAIYDAQRANGKPYLVALSHVAHQLLHIAYSVLLHAKPYAIPARFTATPAPELVMAGA